MEEPEKKINSIAPHRKTNRGISQFLNLEEFNPHQFIEIIIEKKWVILIIFILCTLLSIIYVRYSKPMYQSDLVIQFENSNSASGILGGSSILESDISGSFEYQIEILKSKLLLKQTLLNLGYEVAYYNKGKFLNYELYETKPIEVKILSKNNFILEKKFYFKNKDTQTFEIIDGTKLKLFKYGEIINLYDTKFIITKTKKFKDFDFKKNQSIYFVFNDIKKLTYQLIKNLYVKPVNRFANTAQIIYQDYNKKKATDVVIALAQSFKLHTIGKRSSSTKQVISFLEEQIDKQYEHLKNTENEILEFQIKNNFSRMLDNNNNEPQLRIIEKLQNNLIEINFQKSVVNEIYNSINSNLQNIDIFELLSVLVGTEYEGKLSSLVSRLEKLLLTKQKLLFNVTPESGSIKSIDYQIKTQKKLLFSSIKNLIKKLDKRKKDVEKKMEQLDKQKYKFSEKELKYRRIKRILNIDEKFLNLLITKKTEFSIFEAGIIANHTILEEATESNIPFFPRKKLIYSSAILFSLILSLCIFYIIYLFKNTITYESDINHLVNSNYSFLGLIPKHNKKSEYSELLVTKQPLSFLAESFRIVRSNMQLMFEKDNNSKIISLTSTISGEGKTFCTINLAGIIAYTGKKVILLDLDLRKPKLHHSFKLSNSKGVSTLLTKHSDLDKTIQKTEMENLDIITAGPTPPNPAELIISKNYQKMIYLLKEKYDYIIIDTPPIGIVSDALPILKYSDYPIYLFRQDYSKKSFVQNLDYLIQDNGISNLSALINHVDTSRISYGKTYGYIKSKNSSYYVEEIENS